MPYRSELKRPDLKGQFPCSVCGKVFCHSSSLSRHRMQAHFKCYTCTQCNQEISSNETLRSHMFRIHSISRMFMCRCCNWAFPDKTSLHIHMQSMLRNGTPGDVSVLARSSTEGPGMAGVVGELSPHEMDSSSASSSSPTEGGRDSVSPSLLDTCSPMKATTPTHHNFNNSTANHLLNGSIFPTLNNTETLFTKLRSKVDSLLPHTGNEQSGNAAAHQNTNHHWLAAWLANNPFTSQLNLATIQAHLLSGGNQESLQLEGQGTGGGVDQRNVISNDTDEDGEDIKMKIHPRTTALVGHTGVGDGCSCEETILKEDDELIEEDKSDGHIVDAGGLIINFSNNNSRIKKEATTDENHLTDTTASAATTAPSSTSMNNINNTTISETSLDYSNKIMHNNNNNNNNTSNNGNNSNTNHNGVMNTINDVNHQHHANTSSSTETKTTALLNGSGINSLDSLLEKKGLGVVVRSCNRNKRKATKPQQLASYVLLKNLNGTDEEDHVDETQSCLGPPEKMRAKGMVGVGGGLSEIATTISNSINATATATIITSCNSNNNKPEAQSCYERNKEKEKPEDELSTRDIFKENADLVIGTDNHQNQTDNLHSSTSMNTSNSNCVAGVRLSISSRNNINDINSNNEDSTTSLSTSSSQHKCFECQVIKAKLGMSETRNRFLESKVVSHESKISRLNGQINELQSTIAQYERDQRDLRLHIEKFESKLLECQERAVAALGLLHKGPESLPAVKLLMENLLECTNLTFRSGKTC